jgi:hypothetical protein
MSINSERTAKTAITVFAIGLALASKGASVPYSVPALLYVWG